MDRTLSLLALALAASGAAAATDPPALTIYRADGDALFANGGSPVGDGATRNRGAVMICAPDW